MTEHHPETEEPTAEERRAELPGLGYSGKFDHGEESVEDTADEPAEGTLDPEDGDPATPEPSPSSATTTPPPPATQPWTLNQGGE